MNVIFKVYIFSQIFKKHELHENMYRSKMSTFTEVCYGKSLTSNFFKQDDTTETYAYIKD